ncbi:mitochondrial fission regulator 2 [Mugil cephalus]|uniref:mitochondrial fission regulator 2 n=1 Tax=Mugil cephalus TaxID=48193 RepID=UPI001FB7C432|nr:mitochondrial fission regulator 2 [Mugil cephalus]XP_047429602.1 mitochondrial fission regulator 2 [Mugil cephalus]
MSLVEDVLDVLCMVLEYFGVPPDMLVPVWDSQLCGQYRSIVRMIGTNLPLTPAPRVNFQVPLISYKTHGHVDVTVDTPAIPSFADVLWVFEDEGESFAKTRNHLPPKTRNTVNQDVMMKRYPRPAPNRAGTGGGSVRQAVNPDALKKISALENELLKLRAQIAMIVTDGPASGLTASHDAPASPLSRPPLPAFTSTPHSAAAPPPPPPPPPPLPPSPCLSSSTETSSVLQLIRQRKNEKGLDKGQLRPQEGTEKKGMPSMLDVLKDLNQVKLRSVERSPGGTPVMRRRSKGGGASLNDPAALIAEALKRKFAHHRHNISSDKENSLEVSPFGSPETPMVPHRRRSKGRRHL